MRDKYMHVIKIHCPGLIIKQNLRFVLQLVLILSIFFSHKKLSLIIHSQTTVIFTKLVI